MLEKIKMQKCVRSFVRSSSYFIDTRLAKFGNVSFTFSFTFLKYFNWVVRLNSFPLVLADSVRRLQKWVGFRPSIKSESLFLLHYLSMPNINSTLPNTELTSTFELRWRAGGPSSSYRKM
jgi:hypothetical protein